MARVLLATDRIASRSRAPLRPCLEAAGHQVVEVGDGSAVMHAMRTAPPEVLVMDTALPILDGFQVLARLRREMGPKLVPVVLISGVPAALVEHLVASAGAAACLAKPVSCQSLCDAVSQALGGCLTLPTPARPRATDQQRATSAIGSAQHEPRARGGRQRRPAG